MANNTISADVNPNLVNNIAQAAFAEPVEEIAKAEINAPFNGIVDLPGGYVKPTGEVIKTAEVRELTGRDEEMLGKVTNYNRLFPTILNRAVVSIGNEKATEAMLDSLLVGDRDALLLGIYRATFGPTADFSTACQGCGEVKNVTVDVAADIKSKVLIDPANDRTFTVKGKKDEYLVTLPTGVTQKAMIAADDKNGAEITSVLLENTVLKINETSVVSPIQIKNLGLVDRRTIVQEIYSRNPGPKFENIVLACPDCDGEVVVPISVGGLFRF